MTRAPEYQPMFLTIAFDPSGEGEVQFVAQARVEGSGIAAKVEIKSATTEDLLLDEAVRQLKNLLISMVAERLGQKTIGEPA